MSRLAPRDVWLLFATCLLALALRLWKLDAGLWYDEVLTLTQFVRLPVSEIVTNYSTLNNHVFFSLQAHAAVALFGETAWALRLPAVLLGVAAVPVLFALVRRIGAPLAWAHVSALLLALNYHHIWFSQNARGYTGLIFWCLLATIAFVAGSRRNAIAPWIGFSLAAAAALYTHLSAAFYILSLALIYAGSVPFALRDPQGRTPGFASARPLIAIPLTLLLVLALYGPMIPQMMATFGEVAAPEVAASVAEAVPVWRNPLWTLLEVLRSTPLPLPVVLVLLPVLLVVLSLGFAAVWRLDRCVALALPVSIVVTLALLVAAGMRLWPRYFLIDLPFLLVFATAGTAGLAGWIGRGGRASRLLATTGWTLGVIASLLWASRNYVAPKQDFLGAVALVEASSQPGDIKASLGLASLPLSSYFAPDWTVLATEEDLEASLASGHPVWLVYAFEDHTLGTYPALMARVEAEFEPVRTLRGTLGGGAVHVMRSHAGKD